VTELQCCFIVGRSFLRTLLFPHSEIGSTWQHTLDLITSKFFCHPSHWTSSQHHHPIHNTLHRTATRSYISTPPSVPQRHASAMDVTASRTVASEHDTTLTQAYDALPPAVKKLVRMHFAPVNER